MLSEALQFMPQNCLVLIFKKIVSHLIFVINFNILLVFLFIFRLIMYLKFSQKLIFCWQSVRKKRNDKKNYSPLEISFKHFNYMQPRRNHMQMKSASIKKGGSTM